MSKCTKDPDCKCPKSHPYKPKFPLNNLCYKNKKEYYNNE